jgi:MFS superfamily sulfate permease-like transporter
MTLLAVVLGLREGYRTAWKMLWIVPLLVLVHVYFWPWLTPLLIGIAVLAGIGLGLAWPKALGNQNG